MAERQPLTGGLTVGSLIGVPLGGAGRSAPAAPGPSPAQEQEGPGWSVTRGEVALAGVRPGFRPDGVEAVTYDNPFGQVMERVWFDGKVVYALDLGSVDLEPAKVKVAQEYQIVYSVELDECGRRKAEPLTVPGQLNIYDSIPGMPKYSPIWQFNYVLVPREYEPNALRSEQDCLTSGYPIRRSNDFEN